MKRVHWWGAGVLAAIIIGCCILGNVGNIQEKLYLAVINAGPQTAQVAAIASYSVTVVPTTTTPGGTVTVAWNTPAGVNIQNDWIGVYTKGANTNNQTYHSFKYTNTASGNTTVQLPTTPGQYEIRYLKNNGYALAATSQTVTIQAATTTITPPTAPPSLTTTQTQSTYTLTATPSVTANGNITVSYNAPTTADITNDWIGVYTKGANNQTYLSFKYTTGRSGTLTIVAPSTVGVYEIRYLKNNDYTSVATVNVTVQAGTTSTTQTSTTTSVVTPQTQAQSTYTLTATPNVAPNGNITVTFSTPSGVNITSDWVGIYKAGTANGSSAYDASTNRWVYTKVQNGSVTLTAPAQAGTYEVRYLKNGGYNSVATATVTVQTATTQTTQTVPTVATTTSTIPTAPSNLQATVSNNQVILTWSGTSTHPSGGGNPVYYVERKVGTRAFTQIATTDVATKTFTTSLDTANTVEYRVGVAVNPGHGCTTTTCIKVYSPSVVTGTNQNIKLSARVSTTTSPAVILTWNGGGTDIVERRTGNGNFTQVSVAAGVQQQNTGITYSDQQVVVGTKYEYRIRQSNPAAATQNFDKGIVSSIPVTYSVPVSITVAIVNPIGSVSNIRSSNISHNSVTLTWNATPNAVGYAIYLFDELIATTTKPTYTEPPVLLPETEYTYVIHAVFDWSRVPTEISGTTIQKVSQDTELKPTSFVASVWQAVINLFKALISVSEVGAQSSTQLTIHSAKLPPISKTGNLQITVILADPWPYGGGKWDTIQSVSEKMFGVKDSVAAFYKENSFNKLNISGTVVGPFSVPKYAINNLSGKYSTSGVGRGYDLLTRNLTGINREAWLRGVNLVPLKIYVLPEDSETFVRGAAAYDDDLPGFIFINGFQPGRVYAHEIGHKLGFGHSNLLFGDCLSECVTEVYKSPFEVMSNHSLSHLFPFRKAAAGWIPTRQISQSGLQEIIATELSNTVSTSIRYDTGGLINLDYRRPIGVDNNAEIISNLGNTQIILYNRDNIKTTSNSLGILSDARDAHWMNQVSDGQNYLIDDKVNIIQLSHNNDKSILFVRFFEKIKVALTQQSSTDAQAKVKISWDAISNPSDDLIYRVYRDTRDTFDMIYEGRNLMYIDTVPHDQKLFYLVSAADRFKVLPGKEYFISESDSVTITPKITNNLPTGVTVGGQCKGTAIPLNKPYEGKAIPEYTCDKRGVNYYIRYNNGLATQCGETSDWGEDNNQVCTLP